MHIEFKRVTLHNFMSFGDAELNFRDDGFIRVSGINENPLDNAGSNGSGKSSLWEAIIWSITGETIRGTKQIVNIHGTDGCFVDIEFYVDGKKYQIIRSKDHAVRKTSIQILIDDVDVSGKGIRDSEKLLEQYLPDITASLLGSVIILGQGLPQKFTNNSPSGRKEVLEKLSKSDFMIEDLKKRVSERKRELQATIRSIEDSILQSKTNSKLLTDQLQDAENLLSTLNDADINSTIDTLTSEYEACISIVNELESTQLALQTDLYKLNDELSEVSSKQSAELVTLKNLHSDNSSQYVDELNKLIGESAALKKQLVSLKNITDICPTCGQKLPDVHKPDTSKLESDITSIQLRIDDLNETIRILKLEYENNVNAVTQQYASKITELKSVKQGAERQLQQITSNKAVKLTEQQRLVTQITESQTKLAQLQTTIDNCNKIIRENNEKLNVLNEEFLYNNKQRDLTQSHLEIINKFDTALKRDFRGYLLSTVITFIEARAKQYCELIFNTTELTFALDGNNIDISYCDRAYENLSGGERQKIDLIIQFSIRDMLMNHLNFTSNILVLDEIFDGLDMPGCNRIIDMINNLPDIKNVFIVTHRKDLSIPTDIELVVVKSPAGISEIK